jgi:TRAP-type C4-dicarboxylate transport system permease small subunit
MRAFIFFAEKLSLIGGFIAAGLVGVAILIVTQMVFMRYVLVASTAWQTDVVTFSLVGATLLGSAWVLRERGHVTVDLVTENAPAALRRIFLILSDGVVFIFSALMFWKGWLLTHEAWQGAWVTESMVETPLWIPYAALPIGFGLLALQALAGMAKTAFGLNAPRARTH